MALMQYPDMHILGFKHIVIVLKKNNFIYS